MPDQIRTLLWFSEFSESSKWTNAKTMRTAMTIDETPQRPRPDLGRTPIEIIIEAIAFLALGGIVVLIAASWGSLPEQIPHHFDVAGRPDAWGGKWVLVVLAAISVVLYAMLSAFGRIPHRFNYLWPITAANAPEQYRIAVSLLRILKTEAMFLFGFLTLRMIQSQGLGKGFVPILIATLGVTIFVHLVMAYLNR